MVRAPVPTDDVVDVLFIGDDADVAELYRLKLQLDGYDVRVVGSESAVSAASDHRPEIVFLDYSPPVPDRLQILRAVRRAAGRPDLPAILIADSEAGAITDRRRELTAYDYVITTPAPRAPAPVWLAHSVR
jgi:two-component system OmpR family response regulator